MDGRVSASAYSKADQADHQLLTKPQRPRNSILNPVSGTDQSLKTLM